MEGKKEIRKKVLEELNKLSKPMYEHFSYNIAQKLYHTEEWKEADTIGITVSRPPEVDTYQIIRQAWEENKRVVVPKCYPHTKEMVFRELTRFDELESVYYGLYEPIEEKTRVVSKDEISLLLVPGVAYGKNGYRIGFGGGYYDRFLVDYKGKTISLAFMIQIFDELPYESHDIPVGKIITERGMMDVSF